MIPQSLVGYLAGFPLGSLLIWIVTDSLEGNHNLVLGPIFALAQLAGTCLLLINCPKVATGAQQLVQVDVTAASSEETDDSFATCWILILCIDSSKFLALMRIRTRFQDFVQYCYCNVYWDTCQDIKLIVALNQECKDLLAYRIILSIT